MKMVKDNTNLRQWGRLNGLESSRECLPDNNHPQGCTNPRPRWFFKILSLTLIMVWVGSGLLAGSNLAYGQSVNLADWVELALDTNPEYQLLLQDYQLAMQGIELAEETGIESVGFSATTLSFSQMGVELAPGMSLQLSGELPYGVHVSSSHSLHKESAGSLNLSGNLVLDWNRQEFLQGRQELSEEGLAERSQLYQGRMALIRQVITGYYQLMIQQIRLERDRQEIQLKSFDFKQGKARHQGGLISKYELKQLELEVAQAQDQYEMDQRNLQKQQRDFARIFGGQGSKLEELGWAEQLWSDLIEMDLRVALQRFEEKELAFPVIDQVVADWKATMAETFLMENYEYRLAVESLHQSEEALRKLDQSNDWKLTVGTNLNYNLRRSEPIGVSGSVGVTKNLYQRQFHLQQEQAELSYERSKLVLNQRQDRLTDQMNDQVDEIRFLAGEVAEQRAKLLDWEEDVQRLEKQYQAGFVAEDELVGAEILLLEKLSFYLDERLKQAQAKLELGQLLCLAEFWR